MPQRPLVLIHGYSDIAKGFAKWRRIIESWANLPEHPHRQVREPDRRGHPE